MSVQEFYIDRLVTPKARGGGLLRYRHVSLRVDVRGGKILSISKISPQKMKLRSKKVLRLKTLIPGLVDPHTHCVFAGHRAEEWGRRLKGESYESISKEGGGIKTSVRETRLASQAHLLRLAKKRAKQFLKFGVTSFETKSGYGLDWKTELKLLQVAQSLKRSLAQEVVSTFMAAHALPPEQGSTREFIDEIIREMLPKVAGLAEFQDVFVERGFFSAEDAIRLLRAGKKFGLHPKVHAHEFERTGGVRVACAVGAVSADHLQYLNRSDIAAMKKHRVIPVVLPGTSFFLGAKRFAPAREIWDAGLPLALASDFNPGTNPSMNLPLVGTFAARFSGLQLDEILIAQTRHAAAAINRRDRGVLAPGFRADFVELEAESFEEMYYHYGQSLVRSVYIAGKKAL